MFVYNYDLYDKGLKSLPNDTPKYVGGSFHCHYNKLTSLQGAPKYVGGDFWCHNNTKKFTEKEVRAVCNAKGNIYV